MRPRNAGDFDHRFFARIDREEKAYWLGFLFADGCVYTRARKGAMQLTVCLQDGDASHLSRFCSAIGSRKRPLVYPEKRRCELRHSSDLMCGDLIVHGCTPRKTRSVRFPSLAPALVGHFVRGYFDGDGSASVVGRRLFLEWKGTYNFLRSLRRHLQVRKQLSRRTGVWQLQVGARPTCQRIVDWMYDDATVWLPRKRKAAMRGLSQPFGRIYKRKAA